MDYIYKWSNWKNHGYVVSKQPYHVGVWLSGRGYCTPLDIPLPVFQTSILNEDVYVDSTWNIAEINKHGTLGEFKIRATITSNQPTRPELALHQITIPGLYSPKVNKGEIGWGSYLYVTSTGKWLFIHKSRQVDTFNHDGWDDESIWYRETADKTVTFDVG